MSHLSEHCLGMELGGTVGPSARLCWGRLDGACLCFHSCCCRCIAELLSSWLCPSHTVTVPGLRRIMGVGFVEEGCALVTQNHLKGIEQHRQQVALSFPSSLEVTGDEHNP